MFIRFHEFMRPKGRVDVPSVPEKEPRRYLVQAEYEHDGYYAWERLYLFLYREISIACEWLGIYEGSTKTFYRRRVAYYMLAFVTAMGILIPVAMAAILFIMRCV